MYNSDSDDYDIPEDQPCAPAFHTLSTATATPHLTNARWTKRPITEADLRQNLNRLLTSSATSASIVIVDGIKHYAESTMQQAAQCYEDIILLLKERLTARADILVDVRRMLTEVRSLLRTSSQEMSEQARTMKSSLAEATEIIAKKSRQICEYEAVRMRAFEQEPLSAVNSGDGPFGGGPSSNNNKFTATGRTRPFLNTTNGGGTGSSTSGNGYYRFQYSRPAAGGGVYSRAPSFSEGVGEGPSPLLGPPTTQPLTRPRTAPRSVVQSSDMIYLNSHGVKR
eukprot:PhF_6_TR19646/c0_g1_i1/m.28666